MTLAPLHAAPLPAVQADTDSWTLVVAEVAKLAAHIAGTEFVPRGLRDNPPAVCAAMLYGREVGLAPMTSLSQVYVAEGRPGMHAEGMRALVLAAGHDIETLENTGAVCTLRGRRAGREWAEPVSWNLAMARAAGLLPAKAGSGWVKYPRAMLLARATAELCRRDFPDVIHGLVAIEELSDGLVPDEVASPTTVARKPRAAIEKAPPTVPPPPSPTPPEPPSEPLMPPLPSDVVPEPVGEVGPGTAEPREHRDPAPRKMTSTQRVRIIADLARLGTRDHDDRVDVLSALIGRRVETTNALTHAEASQVLDALTLCGSDADLAVAVGAALDHYARTDDPTVEGQPSLIAALDETPPEPEPEPEPEGLEQ